ncbi:MAG TPA: T9SS type A sorting domain-containing protein [Flavobacterium sp.]|nr:T9SS type A sorting domain-containing protein [Flavobacterium sp.]
MKKILLFLFIVSAFNNYSQVSYSVCDIGNNGIETINLTLLNAQLVTDSGQSPGSAVSYYSSQADATVNTNPIANPSNYVTGTATLFARVQGSTTVFVVTVTVNPLPSPPMAVNVSTCNFYTLPALPTGQSYWTAPAGTGTQVAAGTVITSNQIVYVQNMNASGCTNNSDFMVTINPSPNPNLMDGYLCNTTSPGAYLLDSGLPNVFSFQWYLNDVLIASAAGNTYTATQSGNYTVTASTVSFPTCSASASATVYDSELENISLDIVDQTITVNGAQPGYSYVLDGSAAVFSNTFSNLPLGIHVLTITDQCGNIYTISFNITTPSAPFGATTQTFNTGQTLADIVVTGQNIQWYANASPTGRMAVETPLPLTTVLVNGTTYYASQTINGIESPNRFPVTATVGLGVQNNAFQNLSYYPNPVKNTLSVSNVQDIDSIVIYDVSGQSVLSKSPKDSHPNIDISMLKSGVYFVTISAGGQNKTVRIIKE